MRILWLKTELLHPVDKGGKIRTYQMLKELKRNHHVTYLTLDDGSADATARNLANEYCHELVCVPHRQREKFTSGFYAELGLNLVSKLPYAIKKYVSPGMKREIVARMRAHDFDVLVCDFLAPAGNVPDQLNCPAILFQHNVEAMIWKRHYEVQTNPVKKAYLYDQWRKMHAFEQTMCRQFDSVIAVSREDREFMVSHYNAPNVYDVPTGVDTEFFQASGKEEPVAHSMVFTGSMDWLPNEDAIRYFTEEIMPRIRKQLPGATLTVVGRNPYPALLELSQREPSIVVTGRVDDVRPYMERASAYVVPLRIGGGTRLKIYEAMAMGKAIVSTSIGAEGLPVHDGVELLLEDDPDSFAAAAVRVLTDAELASGIGERAATRVRESFGWDKVADTFAAICEKAISQETVANLAPAKEGTQAAV
ncbi:MAG TPA: glycosyltransferase [Pyrinomonadaceae bacterium]|nr:glycosyltransferase [Pyrinomonadaceae bacterium]